MANSPQRTIVLPADVDAELEELARLQGRSVSGLVRWIVEGFLRAERVRDEQGERA